MNVDNFWLLLNIVAAIISVGISILFFIRNHTFKKWLCFYEAIVIGFYGLIYILTLIGVLKIPTYNAFLRPVAYTILLIPAMERIADWWRKYDSR